MQYIYIYIMRVRARGFVWMFMHTLACVIYCVAVYISTRTFIYGFTCICAWICAVLCGELLFASLFYSYLLFVCLFYPEGVTCFSLRQKQRLRFLSELSYSALSSIITTPNRIPPLLETRRNENNFPTADHISPIKETFIPQKPSFISCIVAVSNEL